MTQWWKDPNKVRAAREQYKTAAAAARALGGSARAVQIAFKDLGLNVSRVEAANYASFSESTPSAVAKKKAETAAEKEASPSEILTLKRKIDRLESENGSLKKQLKVGIKHSNIVEDVADILMPTVRDLSLPAPEMLKISRPDAKSSLIGVLHLTDIHWGEFVNPESVNGVNAYSPDIAAARIQHIVDTTIRLSDNYEPAHRFDELVVVVNGDTIGGAIHPESAEYYARVGKQALDASMIISQVLSELSQRYSKIRYIGTVGNHPRSTKMIPTGPARQHTSWESMIHEMVAALCIRNDSVEYKIATGYTVDAYIGPSRWAFSHGDAISGGGGQLGIPAYGLKKQHDANREWSFVLSSLTESALSNSIVKHTRTGHYHTFFMWQAGSADIALAPSPKGVDPFVKDKLGRYSPPQALFEVVHPVHDLIAQHLIDLSNISDDADKSRYYWGAMESESPVAELLSDRL